MHVHLQGCMHGCLFVCAYTSALCSILKQALLMAFFPPHLTFPFHPSALHMHSKTLKEFDDNFALCILWQWPKQNSCWDIHIYVYTYISQQLFCYMWWMVKQLNKASSTALLPPLNCYTNPTVILWGRRLYSGGKHVHITCNSNQIKSILILWVARDEQHFFLCWNKISTSGFLDGC